MTPEVTEVPGHHISKLMQPGVEKRQGMRGFDADYVDIVDYIVRCTHKIWEEKQVGLIYSHYGHNALDPRHALGTPTASSRSWPARCKRSPCSPTAGSSPTT